MMEIGSFPATRLRRNRQADWLRALVREHHLSVEDLVWPVFVQEGMGQRSPIASMPGVSRFSLDVLVSEAKAAHEVGIPAIALFPATPHEKKDEEGAEALNPENLVCRAVKEVKSAVPGLGVICDVALDPYTLHGHDGVVENGIILNDATVERLCKQALTLAEAGCDVVAPSDMMDGRVGAIRAALDAAGYRDVAILAYAAKYASAFYGPFREAVGSSGNLKGASKATYQMDPANAKEALREVAMDIAEGADMVMVKPGMPFLDIVRQTAEVFHVPVFAYQVSGEYAMLKLAGDAGALDYRRAMLESLLAFKRAGAAAIFTYAARDVAGWLTE